MTTLRLLLFLALSLPLSAALPSETWKAGTAKADITPKTPIWMAGYGGRSKESEGALHPLWVKALALEDASGQRAIIIGTDTLGMTGSIYANLKARLAKEHKLAPAQIMLNASHTHTGPVLRGGLYDIYPLNTERIKRIEEFSARVENEIVRITGEALKNLEPVTLKHGIGITRFGVNRRENKPYSMVPKLIAANALKGPIDHDVPVLAVYKGLELKAVVFGYACHSTVLSFYKFSGDYSGFTQIALEKSHPNALALFSAGCGADINPLPRREVYQAERYGNMLAAAVEEVLLQNMETLKPKLTTRIQTIPLEYGALPAPAALAAAAKNPTHYRGRWAGRMLKLQSTGNLPKTYPYPIQCWRVGDLLWLTMGGEVVVDYSIKFKKQFGARTWVTSYANDVMAYIPSLRVLTEGGYEGQSSMAVYGLPADRWKENVEDLVTEGAKTVVKEARGK
ncbi:MAG: neutral/alkaline non-lysosomal ceramidase N-terminal domain-containing protein [Verrucomicrobia subdivision 3 bacterium]|nr:neutral/alkaline non-lysosomal ceramidase N-terminal domain-containing protein [Limisphaerales bacterium]